MAMAGARRRRQLPAWMAAAAGPGRRAGRAAGRRAAAVYCMNEAELVELALAVLAENLQCEESDEKARSGSEEEREPQPTPHEAPASTAGTGEGGGHSPALPSPRGAGGAGADPDSTGGENSEDDVLKYVREIFFS